MSRGWWSISGDAIIEALRRSHAGDDPEVVYMELYANANDERASDDE